MKDNEGEPGGSLPEKSLVVVYSSHHMNTEKIAHAIAGVLGAPVKTPQQVNPEELREYGLVGFGSGIYSAKNHDSLIDLAGKLPWANGNAAFIFSTFGAPERLFPGDRFAGFIKNNHSALRETLVSRGYTIIDEFGCAGFNTKSVLTLFGGLNKGRPNAADLRHAEEFARNLKRLSGRDNPGTGKDLS